MHRNESDSPRGRIALIKTLADASTEMDRNAEQHLNACLYCRACETVCPSRVPFTQLMDEAKKRTYRPGPFTPFLRAWLRHRWVRLAFRAAIRLGQRVAFYRWGKYLPQPWNRLASLLRPFASSELPRSASPDTDEVVTLFRDCTTDSLNANALSAAETLLHALGVRVEYETSGHCCGALPQHQGDADTAQQLSKGIRQQAKTKQPLLCLPSACGAHLKERLHDSDIPVMDVANYLLQHPRFPQLDFAPLRKRVGLHEPCTLSRQWKLSGIDTQLLQRIPDIELITLPDNERCCGAAGTQLIQQAKQADALLLPKLAHAERLDLDIVVTHNIGCQLHWHQGLQQRPANTRVLHAITLLAQQLRHNPNDEPGD